MAHLSLFREMHASSGVEHVAIGRLSPGPEMYVVVAKNTVLEIFQLVEEDSVWAFPFQICTTLAVSSDGLNSCVAWFLAYDFP
jgi:hypothetical protein